MVCRGGVRSLEIFVQSEAGLLSADFGKGNLRSIGAGRVDNEPETSLARLFFTYSSVPDSTKSVSQLLILSFTLNKSNMWSSKTAAQ